MTLAALFAGAVLGFGDLAYVTAQNAGILSIIDLDAGAEVARVALPGKPAAVACARTGAVVVEPEGGRVSLIGRDGTVARSRDLGSAFGVAATQGGIYVTDWDGARLLKLDPATLETVWAVPTGRAPTGVDAHAGLVAVAERDDDAVALFDAATGALRGRVAVGAHPFGVTLQGGRVFTANVEGDSVSIVDPETLTVGATLPVGDRPYAVAFAAGIGAVSNQGDGTLTLFRDTTILGTVETGESPEGVAVTSDGRFVVANWFSNTLTVVDPQDRRVVAEIDTPDGPRAFGRFVCP